MTKRLVIVGFGDTGLLTALYAGSDFRVVGISAKPCMVSGQELGLRLAAPALWRREYLFPFSSYRRLDRTRVIHGRVLGIDEEASTVSIRQADGEEVEEPYDALVIASGVTNGFWRNDRIETRAEVDARLAERAGRVRAARVLAVVGGGAAGVSVAYNAARRNPEQEVHLFFSRDEPLPEYHPRVRRSIRDRLESVGVRLHARHRARIPDGFECDEITGGPIAWEGDAAPFHADAVIWAIGRRRPNTSFVPREMLDEDGYVICDRRFRVPGRTNVFAIGDVAATDPNRSSARNDGYRILAHNLRQWARGRDDRMKSFEPPAHRWGSILGPQEEGLTVFLPNGRSVRIPRFVVERLLFPVIVRRLIYRGVRALAS